jgi:hypothetical protein
MDKGENYQLEFLFKVNRKMYVYSFPNIAFFLNPKVDLLKIYFLGSYNDYLVTSFFARTNFKLAGLRCFNKGDFESFLKNLE